MEWDQTDTTRNKSLPLTSGAQVSCSIKEKVLQGLTQVLLKF